MKDLPKPTEPVVVTTIFEEENGVEKYKGVAVEELLKGSVEETIWLLWTGKKPSKVQVEFTRMVLIMVADHGPAVAGAYSTILAASAGLKMPQAVAAGVQMIGPRFGGASGQAAAEFQYAVSVAETVEQFEKRMKAKGVSTYPGIGHRVFSKTKPDARVKRLIKFAQKNIRRVHGSSFMVHGKKTTINDERSTINKSNTPHLDFALRLEEELLKKNEKLILNIDGTIGAILMDVGFPLEGVDGFFILARTIGLIAHYIDQKQRGTGLIRLPEELILHK